MKENSPGHTAPKDESKAQDSQVQLGTWAFRGQQRALVSEVVVVSEAGRKYNGKGSEKSLTYFTYYPILLFLNYCKGTSLAGLCTEHFLGRVSEF